MSLTLDPRHIDLVTLRQLWAGAPARLDDPAMRRVAEAAASVGRIVAGGATVYGVNTGFGLLAQTRIPDDRLAELQTNLILSHSAGLGTPLPRHVVRLMIVLKLLGLGRGHSGVRIEVIEALQALLDHDAMPVIPSQGSVGASGDLAPLAHMTAALMGYGSVDVAGTVIPAGAALQRLAEPGAVGEDEVGLQLRQAVGGNRLVSEQAEAGVDAVDCLAGGDDAVDTGGGFADAAHGSIVEPRCGALPELPKSGEVDGFGVEVHAVTIGKSRPCSCAQSMASA